MSAARRAAVVAEALTWLGTPYHHHARVRGRDGGVDCAQFPIAVYTASAEIPDQAPTYASQWHLHRSEELYLAQVERFATEVERDDVGPGDFVIWRWGRTFSHGGIMLDGRTVIHSYIGVGVSTDDIDQHSELSRRDRRFFTLWPAAVLG